MNLRSALVGAWVVVLAGCDGVVGDDVLVLEDGHEQEMDGCPPEGCPFSCRGDSMCADPSRPLCVAGACEVCEDGGRDDARLLWAKADVPGPILPGELLRYRITLENTGATRWSRACEFGLLGQGDELWPGTEETPLDDDERVAPGATREFVFEFPGPHLPGHHTFEWQMTRGGRPFGPSLRFTVDVAACKADSDCRNPAAPTCGSGACQEAPDGDVSLDPAVAEFAALGWTWPVPARRAVCQSFGRKITYQSCGFHTGLDICAPYGAAVVAGAAGKVVHVGPMWLSGTKRGRGPYAIIINHGLNRFTTYGHNRRALVTKGQLVRAGQRIAEIGSLGYSSGPHLHYEVVRGTPFTGRWMVPFANACKHYVNPLGYAKP